MRTLVVEDDYASRLILRKLLEPYCDAEEAVDGEEGVEMFMLALREGQPYDLVCLDIMMPRMDGHEVLERIRHIEDERGIFLGKGAKVLMTSALDDNRSIMRAFTAQCEAYLVKPIERKKLGEQLELLGFVPIAT